MERSLTMLNGSLMDMRAIDRILQAVIFFADSIAIRATYETDPTDVGQSRDLSYLINNLREQGFIKLWAHEYEVNDAGYARSPRGAGGESRPADLVVDRDALAANMTEMDQMFRGMREHAYESSPRGHRRPLRQGVGEIINLRGHLASLVISSELNQDGLLASQATHNALVNGARSSEPFGPGVVREVLSLLQLGSLANLSPDQILECRRYSSDFRSLLDDSLLAVARGSDPVLTPEATARELVGRYKAISSEYALARGEGRRSGGFLWEILGASLPTSLAIGAGDRTFKWRKDEAEMKPYLLLMHLERALAGGRR
ncbi:hypothetical protein [Actinomadura latina]|uniref:Uncharacterized protein n=1 Tax=Actinomadura latina TaxID=163603 RepID=A0A846Z205_9ACTN|nr:hypothetical protein [Actinomadura latina]NKZ04346.1 hypothetical protein [Actinomadura latina]